MAKPRKPTAKLGEAASQADQTIKANGDIEARARRLANAVQGCRPAPHFPDITPAYNPRLPWLARLRPRSRRPRLGQHGVAIRYCEPPLKTKGSRSPYGGASPTSPSSSSTHPARTGLNLQKSGSSRVRLCGQSRAPGLFRRSQPPLRWPLLSVLIPLPVLIALGGSWIVGP